MQESTSDKRKRLKQYYRQSNQSFQAWRDTGSVYNHKPLEVTMPNDLIGMRCGTSTNCGTSTKATGNPCKQKAIYANGRCKLHGGLSTGPLTKEGKQKSAKNGFKKL